jgi:uncharacterized protein YndB with AHSA1/START domain
MARAIRWRLHTASPREKIFQLWTTDEGRERFWAERSRSTEDGFILSFLQGIEEECRIVRMTPPQHFCFEYFGSIVLVELLEDGKGGTDLTLINQGVADAEYEEVHAGWLNVLLPLKAAADFGVDLRTHDPARTWEHGYVDQ